MSTAQRLQAVGQELITKYGNTVTLTFEDKSTAVYDPATDEMVGGVKLTFTKKAIYEKLTYQEYQADMYANVKKKIVIPYDTDVAGITTLWKVDGNSILSIDKIIAQDNTILIHLYIG